MKRKTFLIIATIVPALFGFSLLFVPDMLISTNGLAVSESAKLFARGVGGLLLGVAIINWYARNDTGSPALRGILIGNIVFQAIAFVTDGVAVMNNVITQTTWFGLVVQAVFIVGFGYYSLKLNKKEIL